MTRSQVLSLFSGSNGYLDKVQIKDISRFEQEWLEYVNKSHKDVVEEIQKTGKLDQVGCWVEEIQKIGKLDQVGGGSILPLATEDIHGTSSFRETH